MNKPVDWLFLDEDLYKKDTLSSTKKWESLTPQNRPLRPSDIVTEVHDWIKIVFRVWEGWKNRW